MSPDGLKPSIRMKKNDRSVGKERKERMKGKKNPNNADLAG